MMLTLADALSRGGVTRPLVEGQVLSIGAASVEVLIGGGVWRCLAVAPADFLVGSMVWVAVDASGQGVVLGRKAAPLPLTEEATVDSVGATTMEVTTTAGRTVTVAYLTGTYAPGNNVRLLNTVVPLVLGRSGAAPPPPDPPPPPPDPPPPPTPILQTATVMPTFTGTYRGGWRSDTIDLYQGDWSGRGVNTGAAFYGNNLAALDANLGRPASIRVALRRLSGGAYAPQSATLRTIAQRAKPAGAPTLGLSQALPPMTIGQTINFSLPAGMVTALLNGTAGGLAIHVNGSSPYVHLAGRSQANPAAMSLSVSYYR